MPASATMEDLKASARRSGGRLGAYRPVYGACSRPTSKAKPPRRSSAAPRTTRAVTHRQAAIHRYPILTDGELRGAIQEIFSKSARGFEVPDRRQIDGRREPAAAGPRRAEFQRAWSGNQDEAPGGRARFGSPATCRWRNTSYPSEVAARPVKVTVLSPDRISQRFDWQNSTAVYPDMEHSWRRGVHQVADHRRTAWRPAAAISRSTRRATRPMSTRCRSTACAPAARTRTRTWSARLPPTTPSSPVRRGHLRHPSLQRRSAKRRSRDRQGHAAMASRGPLRWRSRSGSSPNSSTIACCSNTTTSARAACAAAFRAKADKVAVLGLVTTKRADLESLDLLRRRIGEATQYLPAEQLALSPQCGFGGLDSVSIPEEDQWRKFERIHETASLVWG